MTSSLGSEGWQEGLGGAAEGSSALGPERSMSLLSETHFLGFAFSFFSFFF